MKLFSPRLWAIALAAIGLTLTAQPAKAAFISGSGTLGSFEGTFTVTSGGAGSDSATLEICLTNTTPAANGGFITAFAFNNPDLANLTITLTSATKGPDPYPAFETELGGTDDSVNAEPLGLFDEGIGMEDSFQGGGSPVNGVAIGETACWDFTITGLNADELTEQSFFLELTDAGEFFGVRFRGFANGGSDKVGGGGGGGAVVPAPAGLILLATAVPVFALRRIVRRKRAA